VTNYYSRELEAADAGTQIYIRNTNPEERWRGVFQTEIGCATQPRKDKRDNLFVAAEVRGSRLGISAINLRCEALRIISTLAIAAAFGTASPHSTNSCASIPAYRRQS